MYIDIELDDFINLIKNQHSDQETAELVANYLDTDLDSDIYVSNNNYSILSYALIKNTSISYIIDTFYDDNPELVNRCIFEYLTSNNAENIDSDNLCKVLCLLQNEGYITNTGLYNMNLDDTIDDFNVITEHTGYSFIWSEQDFTCESEHLEVIKQLVLAYLKAQYDVQYCYINDEWTNDPYKYIKDHYFGGYHGAREQSALDVLFNNFNKLKADYISYFGEIMPITSSTTLDEFKELCLNSDYNDFSKAYHNLVDYTNFFDETGITDNYFD